MPTTLLEPFADLPVMASLGVACFGSAHRPLGLAALTFGELDLAVEHLEAAVVADLAVGNRPCHTMACATLAELLDRRVAPATASARRRCAAPPSTTPAGSG